VKSASQLIPRHLRGVFPKSASSAMAAVALAISASVIASQGPRPVPSATAQAIAPKPHRWFQVGKASWYGPHFQGKQTANGERFDMNQLTCAHRTLPLGSWLRVTNLRNRRSTFVRVNDRGPYVAGTIVDLSYAAAQRVGLLGKASVRVEAVTPNDPELAHALIAQVVGTEQPIAN
jgi:rare lipoprotein A